jgi:glutathione S-transferase
MTPILFHYPMSPFSEKLRLALGMRNQQWSSVLVPAQPPRPILDSLLGGYRRIPVLQLGSHFYCDSRLAFNALNDGAPQSSVLESHDESLRRRAECEVFFSVLVAATQLKVLSYLAGQLGMIGVGRFMRDRMRMTRDATVVLPSKNAAREHIARYVSCVANRLASQPYLLGASPGYLDLCCFHPLWMACQIDRQRSRDWPSPVIDWMERLGKIPTEPSTCASRDAVSEAIARDQDRVVGEVSEPFCAGEAVVLKPLDYARDKTAGELIALDDESVLLRRRIEAGHDVYLHFPREGFALQAA